MCVDYTNLNKHCPKDPFGLPRKWQSNDEDHDDGVTMVMIKCLDLEKKKEKNKKLKAKVKFDRSFFILVIEILSECDHI